MTGKHPLITSNEFKGVLQRIAIADRVNAELVTLLSAARIIDQCEVLRHATAIDEHRRVIIPINDEYTDELVKYDRRFSNVTDWFEIMNREELLRQAAIYRGPVVTDFYSSACYPMGVPEPRRWSPWVHTR